MHRILSALVAMSFLASCASTPSGTTLPGHKYRTDPKCVRTEPLNTFDAKCDYPVVGYKNFSWDVIPPGTGSAGLSISGL